MFVCSLFNCLLFGLLLLVAFCCFCRRRRRRRCCCCFCCFCCCCCCCLLLLLLLLVLLLLLLSFWLLVCCFCWSLFAVVAVAHLMLSLSSLLLLLFFFVQINIASFALGRVRTGGVAMSCLNLDTPCSEEVLQIIRKIPDIRNVTQVHSNGCPVSLFAMCNMYVVPLAFPPVYSACGRRSLTACVGQLLAHLLCVVFVVDSKRYYDVRTVYLPGINRPIKSNS